MRTHVTVLGWLQIALGVLDLVLGLLVFGVFAGIGILAGASGEPSVPLVSGAVGTVLAAIIAFTAIPNLIAGFGLLGHRNWARIVALILAALNVLKFPWGTVFAIYTFWVLMDDRTRRLFRGY